MPLKKHILIILAITLTNSLSAQTYAQDKQQIIQTILNSDSITMFIHSEIEGRLPVVILQNELIPTSFHILVEDSVAKVMAKPEIKNEKMEAYFEFYETSIARTAAIIKFLYPIEGIDCRVTLERTNSVWKIIRFQSHEY